MPWGRGLQGQRNQGLADSVRTNPALCDRRGQLTSIPQVQTPLCTVSKGSIWRGPVSWCLTARGLCNPSLKGWSQYIGDVHLAVQTNIRRENTLKKWLQRRLCKSGHARSTSVSVEADSVQKGPATLLLKLLQQLIDLVLHILSVLDLEKAEP
ncbi:hypothetical protein LEMLEM_LOCUS5800 [Lemmus lemmus]